MAHPIRIRVLELLSENGEMGVSDLLKEIDIEQSHLSQQLGILRRGGLVSSRREGSHVIYRLAEERIPELLTLSRSMLLEMHTASQAGLSYR